METVTIGDIEAVVIENIGIKIMSWEKLYAHIPLSAVENFPPNFGKVKFYIILWCLSGMVKGSWFRLKNKICEHYDISQRQKTRLLAQFEAAGLIEVRRAPGRTVEVRLQR